ncbi:hybrid sensor histidine kinase/response regulator [Parasphingopyxis marina]|uniref:histidine kinase n=1 Tax=Parasphingopyxis marina TaxID=2761622 RepID=A0A842I045_9SPHN|nr:PAS domain-containing sensor histidine kinase [Parasphingopyxis marina]MBC2778826.1 PAS domain S-box protein [Parasphingopyxis marina]
MRLIDNPKIAELVSEVTDFAVFSLDLEGVCREWEPMSRNYQHTPRENLIGVSLDRYMPRAEREAGAYEKFLLDARTHGVAESEGWRRRWDGSYSWMRIRIAERRDDDGEHIGYLGIVSDASRQRDAARKANSNDEAFRAMVHGIRDHAIYMLDIMGRISNWNSGAEQIKGYTAEEAIGQHFSIFYTEEDLSRNLPQQALEQARVAGRFRDEGWRVRKDGTRFRAEVNIHAIHDDKKRVIGFGKVTRDITEQYEAQQDLMKTQQALDQSEKLRSLGELTGGIAHDFNNLLTVVRGSAELLRSKTLPPEKRDRHVEAIVETADRAAELTSQLLSFARQQPLQPKQLDFNALISGMTALLKRSLGGGVSILNTPGSNLWNVRADPTQLENLILNAAINARDAMSGSGALTLTTANVRGENGEEVCLSISDTGCGMSADVIARAFEPFFTTKGPGKGTGLGLSQAYGFAAQSGGRLEIASEVGRGTTLSLYLPRAVGAKDVGNLAKIDSADAALPRGTRILLVEDSRTVAIFAQSLLEDMGCEVLHAKNAEEALLALDHDAESFDIIFSDIVMPGLSGLDLAAKVRSQKPTLPILLATGYSEAAARGEGGEFPILPKPYKRETLSEMLGKTMSAFRAAA